MAGDTGAVQSAIAPQTIQTPEQFAEALTALRESKGLSIRQVSRDSGVPSATLGGYFSGRHLPNATQLPVLFSVLTALGVTEHAEQAAWHEALLRVRKGAGRRPATSAAAPYRGLNAFTEQDAGLFFGREDVVAALRERVSELPTSGASRMLVLVGPSGSGKSSVLRAGLVPVLPSGTTVTVLVPGADPHESLLLALADEALAQHAPAVLVIDQAEEVFSPEVSPDSRQAFLSGLAELAAAEHPDGCVVVLALRADFYGQAASDPRLLPALRGEQMLLGAMSLDELRAAVVRPAESIGVTVDSALLDVLLRDLAGPRLDGFAYDAGALPLVSHALLSAWQHHRGNELTAGDYAAAGGLHGAVMQSAEQVYSSFDQPGQAATQWLFSQLVLVDPDGAMTRRRVEHDSLRHPDPAIDAALDDVIEGFVAGRLLTAQESTLEISHEALLTAWPRLYEWVLDDLDAARLQSRIAQAARVWEDNGQDQDLLLRGGPLLDAQALASAPRTSPRALTASERQFVAASTQREQTEQQQERQRASRLRAIVAVTTVLAVLATVMAAAALWSRSEAEKQRGVAELSRDEAESAQLAISANTVRERDPAAAAQLALAGYRIAPTVTARSSLLDSTGVATPVRFVGPVGEMHVTATADGGLVALSGKDGSTRLWQREESGTYTQLPDLPASGLEFPGPVYASSFSPDGRLLAAADVDDESSTIQVWDMSDPAAPIALQTREAQGSVQSMVFSPDGRQLLVGTSAASIQRWTTADFSELPAIDGFDGQVKSLAFDPAGRLAAGTEVGSIVLLSGKDFGQRERASVGETAVNSVAFSPDGGTLASGQKSAEVRLWRVTGNGLTQDGKPFGDFQSWVNGVTFSPDGRLLAATSSDGQTKLFSMPDRALVGEMPSPSASTSVQFVDDGRGLLTGEVGGIARLWPLQLPVLPALGDTIWSLHVDADHTTLLAAPGIVDGGLHLYSLADGYPTPSQTLRSEQAGPTDGSSGMSADGRWVAGGTTTGKVAVWERRGASFEPAGVVTNSASLVESVAISDDGTLMAAAADDGAVSVWKLRPGQPPEKLEKLDAGGLALSVAFNPASSVVAVGLSDGTVRLWTLDDGVATEGPRLDGFENYVYAVSFDPSGRYLAAGSTDQTVRIWDVSDPANPSLVGQPLTGPGGALYGLAWNDEGTRLAAGSKDGTVWVWDTSEVSSPMVVATMNSPATDILAVTFGKGDTLYGAGADNAVVEWRTDVPAVADEICVRTGQGLSEQEWQRLVASLGYAPTC